MPAYNPTVSVVIATKAVDDHLEAAVHSILEQTYPDFELIVVLDGLRDPGRVGGADPRVRVLATTSRRGVAAALNTGISASSGELIARLDADDLAAPDRLARQVAEFTRRPELACLGSAATLIDDDGTPLGRIAADTGTRIPVVLLRRNALIHSSTMFRRCAFEAAGCYDETCIRMQDYELWLRLAAIGEIDNLPDELVSYRVHSGQSSRNTPPWTPAVALILRHRMRLARQLGRSSATQHGVNAAWLAAQTMRHLKLRRPAYLTRRGSRV